MRNRILQLQQRLPFGVLSLHVLLIVLAQALSGCGPVCSGTSGSCLNLRVDGSSPNTSDYVSTRLSVWLGGTDLSGAPIVVSGMVKEQGFLPTNLLLQPPPLMSRVDRVSVQMLGWRRDSDALESGSLLLTGRTNLYWPNDEKIEATVNLDTPSVPFSNREELIVGESPRSVVVLDADHNGQLDLAVRDGRASGDSILLLLANTDGTFQPAQTIFQGVAGHTLSELAATDLDADHHTDLVFANTGTGMLHILYGKGDGSFFDPALYFSQTTEPGWINAADLDGDRRVDLLIAGKTGALKILWNEAEEGFKHSTVLAQGNTTASPLNLGAPSLIDANGDGMLDVIAAGIDGSGALQLWKHGSGRMFQSPLMIDAQVPAPFVMTAQDFDGDTWVDLLTSNTSSGSGFVFRKGNGSGMEPRYAQALGNNPQLALATDLNADLLPDLVLTENSAALLGLGNGLGGFQISTCASEHCQLSGNVSFAKAQDLNGDGEPELIFVTAGEGGGNGRVNILRRSPLALKSGMVPIVLDVLPATAPNNVTTTLTVIGANFESGATVTVGGVDCTDVDVLSSSQLTCSFPGKSQTCGGQRIVVTRLDKQASGTLPAEKGLRLSSAVLDFAPAVGFTTGRGAIYPTVGDFNGDGKLDILSVNYWGRNVSVLLGDGTGGFSRPTQYDAGVQPFWIDVGDFNADNKLDFVATNSNNANLRLGDGLGGFGPATDLEPGRVPASLVTGDFNTDQKLDIVTCNHGDHSVTTFLSDGKGGFSAPTTLVLPVMWPTLMGSGDLNGDGLIDLVVPDRGGNAVVVVRGDGRGGFSPPVSLATGVPVERVVIADLNGDRNRDIFAFTWDSPKAVMLLGDGHGGFGAATTIQLEDWLGNFIIRDINGDGKVDLAFVADSTDDAGVLLGDGKGGFGPVSFFRLGTWDRGIAAGEFNGDGLIDLAATSYRDTNVSILLQRCQ